MRPRHILCAVDFSEPSQTALRAAAELASRHEASLTLIHVLADPVAFPDLPAKEDLYASIERDAHEHLAKWQRDARSYGAHEVRAVSRHGAAADVITDFARTGHYDLVVVGTQGRTGLTHVLVGSVAERVVRHAPCPVLVARPRAPLHKVLCAVDFSAESERALDAAIELIRHERAGRLTLVHVVPAPIASEITLDTRNYVAVASEADVQRLAAWKEQARNRGIRDVVTRQHLGSPADRIVAEAAAHDTDLIVIGTHGRTGLRRALLGSVAEHVVQHAPCSVLIVRDVAPA